QHQSFYWLVNLGRVDLEPEVAVEPAGREYRITVTLRNRSEQVSFFNHLLLRDARGEVINPVFWSDNFVTLFPGESRTLTAVVACEDCGDAEPVLDIES
ncbi:MAG: glycoside hydrolase family 2, partial [Alistipes sp.]|nr:glycoside hydrolase family 2 [Alistipes sp.]